MNRLKLAALMITTLLSVQAIAQEQMLTAEQTPAPIRSYVKANFPAAKILAVKKDKELSKTDYEVKLDKDIELVFDKNFNITGIESKVALPEKVVPRKLGDFVLGKYPNNNIVGWEKERKGQKVELDNDMDLYFDLNGKFIKSGD